MPNSIHRALQPDIELIDFRSDREVNLTKCVVCGRRAIYALGDQYLCRLHATQAQAAINKLRGDSDDHPNGGF